jgi:hypothetical protein
MGQSEIKTLFFENPGKEFYLRQIARLTKTPKTTAARILDGFIGEGLIKRLRREPNDVYLADSESTMYRFYKRFAIAEKLHKSGLTAYCRGKPS